MGMITETITKKVDDRTVVIWRSEDASRPPRGVVVVGPGAGQRMHNLAAIALYLVSNGFVVYRFDALDHHGLSDGHHADFNLTSFYRSLRCATATAAGREGTSVSIVALSVMGRVAFRLAAEEPAAVAQVITVVGVVDFRATVARVAGFDVMGGPYEDVPVYLDVDRRDVGVRKCWHDCRENDWLMLESTIADLSGISAPVTSFVAEGDEWVMLAEVERAFAAGAAGPRHLYVLPAGAHTIGHNPVATRIVLGQLTKVLSGADGAVSPTEIREPSFEELIELSVAERTRAKALDRATRSVRQTEPANR